MASKPTTRPAPPTDLTYDRIVDGKSAGTEAASGEFAPVARHGETLVLTKDSAAAMEKYQREVAEFDAAQAAEEAKAADDAAKAAKREASAGAKREVQADTGDQPK